MRHTDRTFLIAAAVCAGAAVLLGVTLVRALTVGPMPAGPAGPLAPVTDHAVLGSSPEDAVEVLPPGADAPMHSPEVVTPPAETRPLTMDALQLAIDNDPFREDRQRPPERYRMPGDAIEPQGPPPLPPPPPFQVLGIAQSPGGGLAVMQIADSPPRVVSVGESLFGYTLDRVEGEVATLSGQGRILTLTVAQASPTPVLLEEDAEGRGRRSRGRNAEEVLERLRSRRNGENETFEQAREMQQNAVEMIRRMMEQQQRQRGNNRGGNNDASSVYWTPFTTDRYRTTTVPLERGRIIIRADTNTTAQPRR